GQGQGQAEGRAVVDVHAAETGQQGIGGRVVAGVGGRGPGAGGTQGVREQGLQEGGGGGGEALVQGGRADGRAEVGGQLGQVRQGGGGVMQPAEDGDLGEGRTGQLARAADEAGGACGVG